MSDDKKENLKGIKEILELSEENLEKLTLGFKELISTGNMYLVKDQNGYSGRFSESGIMSIQAQLDGVPTGRMIDVVAGLAFFISMVSIFGGDVTARRMKLDEKYDAKIKLVWEKLKQLSAVSDFLYQANTLGNRIIGATVQVLPKLVPVTPGDLNMYPCADFVFGTSMGAEGDKQRFEIGIADLGILIDRLKSAQEELERLQKEVIDKQK